MGAQSLLCRGTALRGRDDRLAHPLQAVGAEQCRYHLLYLLALPALGDQALVEPVCRRGEDQALVDPHDGGAHRSRLWWSGLHHPHLVLASGLALLFLGDGLLKCYPRHRRRRFLHAWAQCPSADILCGHPLHVLPSGHHLRPRCPGDDRRQPAGGSRTHRAGMPQRPAS